MKKIGLIGGVTWTSIPSFDMDRRVIGWFPDDHILLSGYAEHLNLVGINPL